MVATVYQEDMFIFPEGKRYNTAAGRYRKIYGERLQKLVLDAGFSCPNRDGTLGTGGCTYCDNAAFHPGYSIPGKTLFQQIDEGIWFHHRRYPKVRHYLAYFQAYSNTYGPIERLKGLYEEALSHPSVVGLVIGTRPDCIDEAKLDYLSHLAEKKVVVLEYGIESCYDATLRVEQESVEDYKAAEYWNKFKYILSTTDPEVGDVNGDGMVSIADVSDLIDMLLSGEELPAYADVNGDGKVSITDITALIDLLVSSN